MSNDRRALLRRELLKEQLAKESSGNATDSFSFPGANSAIGEALQGGASAFVNNAPAYGTGVAQGASLGFSDELGGMKDLAVAGLKGENKGLNLVPSFEAPNAPTLLTKYRELQKAREAANKQLSDESPYIYGAGELTGGLIASALTPGVGAAQGMGNLTKAVTAPYRAGTAASEAVAGLSPKIAAFLEGQTASKAANIAGPASKMAIEGAPMGGMMGAGYSEHGVENLNELAGDVGSGMAMGSGTGLAIGGSAAAGKKLLEVAPDVLNNWDWTRKLGVASDFADKEGVEFATAAGKDKIANLLRQYPDDITNKMLKADSLLGSQVGKSLEKAEAAGVRINVDPQLQASSKEIFDAFAADPLLLQTVDPKSKTLLMKLGQGGVGDMSPTEARELKDMFYGLRDKLDGISSTAAHMAREKGAQLGSALDMKLKAIPEYAQEAEKFSGFRSGLPEVALEPGVVQDKRTKYLGGLKNRANALVKANSNTIGGAMLPGKSALSNRSGLNEMVDNLKTIEQTSPEVMPILGGSADEVGANLKNTADKMAVLQESQGHAPNEGIGKLSVGSLVGSGPGFSYGLANKYGAMKKTVRDSMPVQAAKSAYAASDAKLMGVANQLKSSDASRPLGEALEKALQNKDVMAKNAALFKMLQIPEYRMMLSDGEGNE